jgi:hypothetical protein
MDAAKIIDILALGRAFIEAGHYKGSLAADAGGMPRDWTSPNAVQFCAVGAYRRARLELTDNGLTCVEDERDLIDSVLWDLLANAAGHPRYDGTELPRWNDDPQTTQEDVLRAYERAAQKVGKSGDGGRRGRKLPRCRPRPAWRSGRRWRSPPR